MWWHHHGGWLTALSIGLSLAGIMLIPVVIVRLPADYFAPTEPRHVPARHSLVGLAMAVLKNAVGVALVLLGLFLSLPLVPGPGVLAILFGLSLMNFPGKRRLEMKLLKLPGLLAGVNALRRRFGRAPLGLPAP
jgi:hypothetical protein